MKQWDRERILVKEARSEGESLGRAKEKNHINRLNLILLKQGRIDDLTKAATDTAFQDKLISELLGDDADMADDEP